MKTETLITEVCIFEDFMTRSENVTEELDQMADLLEAKDVDSEFEELIENARFTASHNPVSETAMDLREELMSALQEVV